MDNSVAVLVEYSPPTKEIHNKRRSSVFKRQSIIQANEDLDNDEATKTIIPESKKSKLEDKNDCNSFDIEKYIESLNEEDKNWREEYLKRKSRVRDLKKHNKNEEEPKQSLDITFLSDSERAFLALKPNYKNINKKIFELRAMATKVGYLNMCAENFYENSLLKLQEFTNSAVHRIINLTD